LTAPDPILVRAVPFSAPDARTLTRAALADLAGRYGGEGDGNVISDLDFTPPAGWFCVAYLGGSPVGCGGWRTLDGDGSLAEIKRMYTVPERRGQGVARATLAAIEDSARAAGCRRLVLETGLAQPEAIALYERCGYERIPNYGYYRESAQCVSFGRDLV
jgi:GNAT superfamily N-acetyltransferase